MSTPQIDTAKIAETAFLIWIEEGRPEGRDKDHWFRAAEALSTAAKPTRKPRAKATAKPTAKKPAARTAATAKAKSPTKAATTAKRASPRKPRKNAEA